MYHITWILSNWIFPPRPTIEYIRCHLVWYINYIDNLFHHLPISHRVHEHQLFMDRQIYVIVPWIPFWNIHSSKTNIATTKWTLNEDVFPIEMKLDTVGDPTNIALLENGGPGLSRWFPILEMGMFHYCYVIVYQRVGVVTSNRLNGPWTVGSAPGSTYGRKSTAALTSWTKRSDPCHGEETGCFMRKFSAAHVSQRHPSQCHPP